MSDDEIIRRHAWELSSTLNTLLWSLEHGIGVRKSVAKAEDLRDRIRRQREEDGALAKEERKG